MVHPQDRAPIISCRASKTGRLHALQDGLTRPLSYRQHRFATFRLVPLGRLPAGLLRLQASGYVLGQPGQAEGHSGEVSAARVREQRRVRRFAKRLKPKPKQTTTTLFGPAKSEPGDA